MKRLGVNQDLAGGQLKRVGAPSEGTDGVNKDFVTAAIAAAGSGGGSGVTVAQVKALARRATLRYSVR